MELKILMIMGYVEYLPSRGMHFTVRIDPKEMDKRARAFGHCHLLKARSMFTVRECEHLLHSSQLRKNEKEIPTRGSDH